MAEENKHGGTREGAGRKSRADEHKLIDKLSPMEKDALKALKEGIKNNNNWAIKLFFEYMYGKAKEHKEIDLNTDGINIIIGK